MIQTQDVDN